MAITISNGTNTYTFSGVNNVSDSHQSPNVSINGANQGSAQTQLYNVMGLTRDFSFDFQIINDGTDHSNGASKVTIDEQYLYLKDTLLSGAFATQYTLTIGSLLTVKGLIEELSIQITFNNPNFYRGTIRIKQGANPLAGVLNGSYRTRDL